MVNHLLTHLGTNDENTCNGTTCYAYLQCHCKSVLTSSVISLLFACDKNQFNAQNVPVKQMKRSMGETVKRRTHSEKTWGQIFTLYIGI